MWETLNSLQIIGYMSYFNVYQPTHVSTFYEMVLELAELDFIDLTPQAQQVYPFLQTEEEPESDESTQAGRRLGYTIGNSDEANEDNRGDLLQTVGTLMLVALLIPIFLIYVFVLYALKNFDQSIANKFQALMSSIFWNGPLRYWIESYASISLAYVTWSAIPKKWETGADWTINIFCILHFAVYIFSPIFVRKFFKRNFHRFKDPDFKRSFHEVIGRLNYHYDTSPNYFVIFCYRRLILMLLIVYLPEHGAQQVQIQMLVIQAVFISMGFSYVYRWREEKNLEFFNETCILLCGYTYFLFSDFLPDPVLRQTVGNYLLYFTGLNVFVNMFLILKVTI